MPEKENQPEETAEAGPEKNPEPQKNPAKNSAQQKPPAYFWALLVIALLVAFGLIAKLSVPEQQLKLKSQDSGPQPEYLRIILITSKDCVACDKEHSFMVLLKQNKIPTQLQQFDANSADGSKILRDFGIKDVPVVLVGKPTISDKFLVKTKSSGFAKLEDVIKFYQKTNPGIVFTDNTIVIPEIGFDSVPRTTFLQDNASCGSASQAQVFVFTDPYCETCIVSEALLDKFRLDFNSDNSNVSMDYYFIPTTSAELDAKNKSTDAALAVNYLQCAQTARGLDAFRKSFYTTYCGYIGKVEDNNPDYLTCRMLNNRWMQPLTQEELGKRLDEAKVNRDVFDQCIPHAGDDIESNKALAVKDNIDVTPLAVVDCQYKTPVENLASTVCALHPEFLACKKFSDSNSTSTAQ
ncbi:MAG: hypothetical protein HY394_04865 [Candidatus Diapherotrites archaeon]|nr:hypothetical protein [Candidatus Diapherotrites archaeon]